MELILQKVCGRPAQLPIRLRRCGPADAAAFFALQNEVRAAMPHPEQFVPDTLENITAYLREDLCIGAYDGERLGAYFIQYGTSSGSPPHPAAGGCTLSCSRPA